MSAALTTADPPEKKAKKPKGGGLGMIGVFLCCVIGAAAGGAGALVGMAKFAPGLIGAHAEAPAAPSPAAAPTALDYIEIDNAFTSNLSDTGRYLQVRISVSSDGGPPVAAAIVKHKPAIVSAVLSVLGELGEADVADRAAKDRLRAKIRTAINEVLNRNAGVSGVREVFIVSLVVQ